MSAQDKTEQVLREMHIMYANSEVYDKATNRVIIDKKEALPDRSCIRMRRFTAYRISCRMRWTLSGRSAIR